MSSRGSSWRAKPYPYGAARVLARELGLSHVTATVLARRGLTDPASARAFLEARVEHDPLAFEGIGAAVELIAGHLRRGSTIAIHGDYDVDGVCSTALLVRKLRALGADVRARIPSRDEDGYGLSAQTVEQLSGQDVELLVTADCGIGALDEVALARSRGIDVVVTDHHRPGPALPDCPVVHPGVCGYPFADLCATGVAYKLAQALWTALGRDRAELEDELDLVALATVADVVPLVDENRKLVRDGMRAIAATSRPGLRALMRVAGVEPQRLREHSLGFALAPRINAAGRLYRADAGLELLLTEDPERALEIARELDAINSERQAVETRILFEAETQLSAEPERRDEPALVLAGEGWHPGVIGIVASRMVERYHRPAVLIALDDDGRGRGSGRSIGAYDLLAGLTACARHLDRFGGHRMAAGLELRAEAVEGLRSDLVEHARSLLGPEELSAVEAVDAIVSGESLGLGLAEELDRLRPFGMGNPGVNLLVPAARLSDVRRMGSDGRHSRFAVKSAGVRTRVVAFGVNEHAIGNGNGNGNGNGERHDLIARLEANEWQGAVEPRLVLRSIHQVDPDDDCAGGCCECACRARGSEWWDAVWREFDRPLGAHRPSPAGAPRELVDARGGGALGHLSDLLSSGESVLVACADGSRRRGLLDRELRAERFGRPAGIAISERCRRSNVAALREGIDAQSFVLADYATLAAEPELLLSFGHVVALDPPAHAAHDALLRASAPASAGHFLHLAWGQAEVELATRALEQELSLRAPLAAIFRALAAEAEGAADARLESLLAGDGRHPRTPALVGRCLRVLTELSIVALERTAATVKCTIISRARVELDRSDAFRACDALHREGLAFLSGQTHLEKARAA